MTSKQFGDYIVTVGEMSWKTQLQCAREFTTWITHEAEDLDVFNKQVSIATLVTLYAPIVLSREGERVSTGTFDLGEGVTLTLPLTRESLDNLPTTLAQFLVTGAVQENQTVLDNFLAGAQTLVLRLSGRS
jgi:hypothetical protein